MALLVYMQNRTALLTIRLPADLTAKVQIEELVLNGTYDENLIELNRIREKRQEDE